MNFNIQGKLSFKLYTLHQVELKMRGTSLFAQNSTEKTPKIYHAKVFPSTIDMKQHLDTIPSTELIRFKQFIFKRKSDGKEVYLTVTGSITYS